MMVKNSKTCQKSSRNMVFCICLTIVIVQVVQTMIRFTHDPIGTNLSMEDSAIEMFPEITICLPPQSTHAYKKDILQNCGVT